MKQAAIFHSSEPSHAQTPWFLAGGAKSPQTRSLAGGLPPPGPPTFSFPLYGRPAAVWCPTPGTGAGAVWRLQKVFQRLCWAFLHWKVCFNHNKGLDLKLPGFSCRMLGADMAKSIRKN